MSNYNVVLVNPEIPQNTGNIGRLCVSTNTNLHLIEPLGFSLDDKYVKRSGMDYWQHLSIATYSNWDKFLEQQTQRDFYFFSTKGTKSFWDCPFNPGSFLVFGSEGHGLPANFYEQYEEQMYTIPMSGKYHRSLNLSNSVAIALFEGLRRQR